MISFYNRDEKCFTAQFVLALYTKQITFICVKGQANKLVTIKRQPELYSEKQHVETSNSEAPFSFFTRSLIGVLNMNAERSEWGARKVTGRPRNHGSIPGGMDETFLYSKPSKMILGLTQPPI